MNKPRKNMKSRWSIKYKRRINCSKPKGFSQRNYCKRQKRGGKYKTFKEWLENHEFEPEYLGELFNRAEDWGDFVHYLRIQLKDDPTLRFNIVADWVNIQKTRAAKALLDMYKNRLNIDKFAIKATREQYNQDVNAFQSGLEWIEKL